MEKLTAELIHGHAATVKGCVEEIELILQEYSAHLPLPFRKEIRDTLEAIEDAGNKIHDALLSRADDRTLMQQIHHRHPDWKPCPTWTAEEGCHCDPVFSCQGGK